MASDVPRPAHARNPPDPGVYRRRRLGALVVLACTVALLSAFLRAVTGGGEDGATPAAEAHPEVLRTVATPVATPTHTPGPTTTATPAATRLARATPPGEGLVIPESAGGRLVSVGLDLGPSTPAGRRVRYAVEIEAGLPVDGDSFARSLHTVLVDRRGWQRIEHIRFVQVQRGADADLTVSLTSPALTDRLCRPLNTRGRLSCWNGERAVLNARRWANGAATYGGDVSGYRRYLIAHEVGHGLGRHHVNCPRPRAPAPVMVQQTKSLEGCVANPFPSVGL